VKTGDAVLRDNLFGLELDPSLHLDRPFCSLALAYWKAGGYPGATLLNIACSGLPASGGCTGFAALRLVGGEMEATTAASSPLPAGPGLGQPKVIQERVARERGERRALHRVHVRPGGAESRADGRGTGEEHADDPAATYLRWRFPQRVARATPTSLTRRYHLVVTDVHYLARRKQATLRAAR